jgi:zinc protease
LREDLGGTYNVDVRGSAIRDPVPQYQFSIAFGSAPDRVDELVDVIFSEIQKLKDDGPLIEDIVKVREMQFRSRETNLRQNQFWLGQLMTYHQYGWELEEIPTMARRLATVEPATVHEAALRYLDVENYVRVSLLPEEGLANAAGL